MLQPVSIRVGEIFLGRKNTRINTFYISESINGVINMVILVIKELVYFKIDIGFF